MKILFHQGGYLSLAADQVHLKLETTTAQVELFYSRLIALIKASKPKQKRPVVMVNKKQKKGAGKKGSGLGKKSAKGGVSKSSKLKKANVSLLEKAMDSLIGSF